MSRSKWKFPLVYQTYKNKKNEQPFFTKNRNITIFPELVNKSIYVYNGKIYIKIKIVEEMIGHKLGEFSPTRKKFSFRRKNKS